MNEPISGIVSIAFNGVRANVYHQNSKVFSNSQQIKNISMRNALQFRMVLVNVDRNACCCCYFSRQNRRENMYTHFEIINRRVNAGNA